MPRLTRSGKRLLSLAVWLAGLLVFFCLGAWNIKVSEDDAENRLAGEAGRAAAQLAGLIGPSRNEPADMAANAIISAAMEDDRIYAVKVETRDGFSEGQRRNYLWDPIPWDDEIAENCVQGMNPLKMGGRVVGKVEVWLSPRLNEEDDALLTRREIWRFCVFAALWTLAFAFLFWQTGDFRRLGKFLAQKPEALEKNDGELIGRLKRDSGEEVAKSTVVDPELGRKYQRRNPDAWLVTAGMFRQTFGRAPELINRLYSEGEIAGLCHLGRILEQAAPCVGAAELEKAAREMQMALNIPGAEVQAMRAEECARALEKTLNALGGVTKRAATDGS